MKTAVKFLVNEIEKEIDYIIYNNELTNNGYGIEKSFEYGTFTYDISVNEIINLYLDDWDSADYIITLEVKRVYITNESSLLLTNLSNEVFNQLEQEYTNY